MLQYCWERLVVFCFVIFSKKQICDFHLMKIWKAEVEVELQETVTRQDSVKGLAGTQGKAVLENASCSEVQESLVLCDPQ